MRHSFLAHSFCHSLLFIFSVLKSAEAIPINENYSEFEKNVQEQAEYLGLAQKDVWKKLLVYSDGRQEESYILSDDFFLSAEGASNPDAELKATISAFFSPEKDNSNEHSQCLFRGRFVWLKSQLDILDQGLKEAGLDARCPAYDEWSKSEENSSISLIYATGYLGNPASFYGHILLKLDASVIGATPLEDQSINFGAIVPPNENMVAYTIKGLVGSYEAGFTHREYFYHTHNYGENDLRDMWEYSLNLSQGERELLTGHAWELLGKKYRYYFFNRNCAFHMAELLELISGVEVVPDFPLWAIPQNVIQNLGEMYREGEPLLKEVTYLPSRQSRFYQKYMKLNALERKAFNDFAVGIQRLGNDKLSEFDDQAKKRILQTIIDYSQYTSISNPESDSEASRLYQEALKLMFTLPEGNAFDSMFLMDPPHEGRRPSRLYTRTSQGSGNNDSNLYVGIRPAYYDVLDTDSGHPKHSQLVMGEVELKLVNDSARLNRLSLFKVENVNRLATGLPGDIPDYWGVSLEIENDTLGCERCLLPRFSASKGRVFSPSVDFTLVAYLGGVIQGTGINHENLFIETGGIFAWDYSEKITFSARAKMLGSLDERHHHRARWELSGRYEISEEIDVRASYLNDDLNEYSLSLGWYW